ncbi:HNH endonuclease [Nocardia jiangxiensis]|uniref:HNH endonuclease n=1 Tax=Nocardia jiangxiensis TaxID=282685 RepID=UPI0012F68092|nr:HNH endonuclease [Nocardia jiangxiensis]
MSKPVCEIENCNDPVYCKKKCRPHYRKAYEAENREKLLANKRARYYENRDKNLADMRDYYWRNKEASQERFKNWCEANPGYFRDRYLANKEHILAMNKEWRDGHPEYFRAHSARRRHQGAVGMTAQDKIDSVEWRKRIANDPCYYCGKSAESMHVDHMNPLSRGGTDHWWNLVRSCQQCNLRKNAKTAEEFIEELDRCLQPIES